MYGIMNPEMNCYTLGPTREQYVIKEYDRCKEYVLSKSSIMYKYVLVKHESKKVGFNLNIKINTRWWKYVIIPKITISKFTRYFNFEWLILSVSCEPTFEWFPKEIIKDHYKEQEILKNE